VAILNNSKGRTERNRSEYICLVIQNKCGMRVSDGLGRSHNMHQVLPVLDGTGLLSRTTCHPNSIRVSDVRLIDVKSCVRMEL
jgi:hypothetical protein